MDARNFILTYYRDATDGMHVQCIRHSTEAQKPHTHMYFQIYYIAAGTLEHFVQERTATLSRGDMFIVPPGVQHRIAPSSDALFYTFSFMPEILGEPGACSAMAIHFLRDLENAQDHKIPPVITTPAEDVLHIEDLFKQMLATFQKKAPGGSAVLLSYGNLLVTLLAKSFYETAQTNFPTLKNNRQAILRGISYIEQNYAEDLNLEHLARYCAMSKSSFSTLFSQTAGTTFNRFLNHCRIEHACKYIRQGYSITGIYGLCGYRDFSTFYRNFKKITGLSPELFKRSLKN
jgi:AraC-like DNA-binding protein/mannose-6-phosphate isomerase-like protein (cupin superfamily)